MTTGLSTIGPRLAKLLPLLSSDQPGEVVATARAIGQTLQRGGMDWHDLAALVSGESKRQAAPASPSPTWHRARPGSRSPCWLGGHCDPAGSYSARAATRAAAWAGGVGAAAGRSGGMARRTVADGV